MAGAVSELSDDPPINYENRQKQIINPGGIFILWHRQLGHLSIRNAKCLMKFDATYGIKKLILDNIKICHPFSISKSENQPFSLPSWIKINAPGDLVTADLIGPLPLRIDNKKYALMIQDLYSSLNSIIPLTNKSEAKHQLCL
ncbi:hypothetical protein O181_099078 [Austropuccinia psidii MF-1]|uniref:GAG-pre-integrase domain-containing protein n=1 Tax=Austropuccinia psidii MF-1 TaxID=1389203 RepID=A0A9Q3JC15_9BASI|nr:hypothetical protein [Austropuccinia psidii MF-1]